MTRARFVFRGGGGGLKYLWQYLNIYASSIAVRTNTAESIWWIDTKVAKFAGQTNKPPESGQQKLLFTQVQAYMAGCIELPIPRTRSREKR